MIFLHYVNVYWKCWLGSTSLSKMICVIGNQNNTISYVIYNIIVSWRHICERYNHAGYVTRHKYPIKSERQYPTWNPLVTFVSTVNVKVSSHTPWYINIIFFPKWLKSCHCNICKLINFSECLFGTCIKSFSVSLKDFYLFFVLLTSFWDRSKQSSVQHWSTE